MEIIILQLSDENKASCAARFTAKGSQSPPAAGHYRTTNGVVIVDEYSMSASLFLGRGEMPPLLI
jgi:hypothetical protein